MKLFKQKIIGFLNNWTPSVSSTVEGSGVPINQNYRTTFNVTDDEIAVKVEKIIRPDLTRFDTIDEEVLPQITFDVVAERTFVPQDFPKTTDHISWFVKFDAVTQTISEPQQLFDAVKRNGNTTDSIWRSYYSLFNFENIPLFFLQNFDRLAEGFSKSVLVLYHDSGNDSAILDTIIEESVAGDIELIGFPEFSAWSLQNIAPKIQFNIKDAEGNPVTATVTQRTDQQLHNQYRVSLVPGVYTIDTVFTKPEYSNLSNRYDVVTVNGTINKTRIDIASGTVPIQYNLTGLIAGETAKLKLNIGKFTSFGELWVDVI
jgi:hypothetical protein